MDKWVNKNGEVSAHVPRYPIFACQFEEGHAQGEKNEPQLKMLIYQDPLICLRFEIDQRKYNSNQIPCMDFSNTKNLQIP